MIKKDSTSNKSLECYDTLALIADEIFSSRKKLGISQEQLAEKSKTTQRIISNIENGSYKMSFDILRRIAEALETCLTFGEVSFDYRKNKF